VWNDAFVQNIITTHGFRYATAQETRSMIDDNFGTPTTVSPGDAAGYASAQSFFNLFGVNANFSCSGPNGTFAGPRTQGLTADSSSVGRHLGFGMIQLGTNGWLIANNAWPDSIADTQMGSFLVRAAPPSVPEPASMLLLGTGLVGVATRLRRRQ
jgi:hypothetical protein